MAADLHHAHAEARSGPRPCAVARPAPGDGVGEALRAAFLPREAQLPGDLGALLDRLR